MNHILTKQMGIHYKNINLVSWSGLGL